MFIRSGLRPPPPSLRRASPRAPSRGDPLGRADRATSHLDADGLAPDEVGSHDRVSGTCQETWRTSRVAWRARTARTQGVAAGRSAQRTSEQRLAAGGGAPDPDEHERP